MFGQIVGRLCDSMHPVLTADIYIWIVAQENTQFVKKKIKHTYMSRLISIDSWMAECRK